MIVKVLDDDGVRHHRRRRRGHPLRRRQRRAGDQPARWPATTTTRAWPRRCKAAGAANALVVASAGNDGRDIDQQPTYPAALPAPNLLAVASTDPDVGRGISELLQLRPPGGAGRRPRRADPLQRQRRRLGAQVRHLDGRPDGRRRRRAGRQRQPADHRGRPARPADAERRPLPAAGRRRLRRRAAHVLAASPAAGFDTTQPPTAEDPHRHPQGPPHAIQAAALGSTAAISRYRITLGGQTAAAHRPPLPVHRRSAPQRGARCASTRWTRPAARSPARSAGSTQLRKGKRDVSTRRQRRHMSARRRAARRAAASARRRRAGARRPDRSA